MLTARVDPVVPNSWAAELEQLFEAQYRLVYRTAYSLTGSVHDAEDILQTIFLRLLARENAVDLKRDPEPYLYRAAFNLSMNVIRSRQKQVLTDNIEPFEKRNPSDSSAEQDMDDRLQRAIAQLPTAAAQVVILRYVHNKSQADIARVMGTTRGTIAVSLFRARARLKQLLREPSEKNHESKQR